MSHLRAAAARADRREGGRHGRPVTRTAPSLPETRIRLRLLRLAVLPPAVVALAAAAAVLFTARSTAARPGPAVWTVLAGASAVALGGVLTAAVAAGRAARSVTERIDALRRSTARREVDLHALVETLRHGRTPHRRTPRGGPPDDADAFELLAADLARAHDGAVTAVVQAARLPGRTGSEHKLEVFVNLARRLQSLVHREISLLDELEKEMEDPDLLKGLFHVDHLATRIRRHAESLAVLGGAVSRRQWSHPVSMTEVLRSAIAEVEQYSRVKLVPPVEGLLHGHAVADVIHLLAELVENATVFSAPQTQVLLRADLVTSGLAVEVEDRGLGMPVAEQARMNSLLANPDQVNVAGLLADGRIGLYVVSQLARRHGIAVRLQSNIYGGVQAVLVVPQTLLGTTEAGMGTGAAVRPVSEAPGNLPQPHRAPGDGAHRAPAPRPPYADGAVRPSGVVAPAAGGVLGDRGGGADGRRTAAPAPASVAGGGDVPTASAADAHSPAGAPSGPVLPPSGAGTLDAFPVPGDDGTNPPPVTGARGSGELAPAGAGTDGATPHAGANPLGGHGAGPSAPSPFLGPGGPAPSVPGDGARPAGGGAPAPLPRRGSGAGRPNPAEAVPGVRPGDRDAVAANAGVVPGPRGGMVRDTTGRPQLPRRRAQQHIAPRLRGGPAPRRDTEDVAGHDPGLMAAFQRGIGLAEAQPRREPLPAEAETDSDRPDGPGSAPGTAPPGAPPHDPSPAPEGGPAPAPPAPDLTTRHDGGAPAG